MQFLKALCLVCLLALPLSSPAQTVGPNSLGPGKKQSHYAPGRATSPKLRKTKVQHTAQFEFYKRVEKAAREKQKILRKLHRDQFSDSRYFGHKRIPRRYPSFKMRYCNECGIRH